MYNKSFDTTISCLFLPFFAFLLAGFFFILSYLTWNSSLPELIYYSKFEFNYFLIVGIYLLIVYLVGQICSIKQSTNYEKLTSIKFFNCFLILSIIINIIILYYSIYAIKPSEEFKNDLNKSVASYSLNVTRLNLDNLQVQMKCCGFNNYKDYLKFNNPKLPHGIPISCCEMKEEGYYCSDRFTYKRGCYQAYLRRVDTFTNFSLITLYVSLSIQLFAVTLIVYLIRKFNYELIIDKLKKNKSLFEI